jgi:hypothetical protein
MAFLKDMEGLRTYFFYLYAHLISKGLNNKELLMKFLKKTEAWNNGKKA